MQYDDEWKHDLNAVYYPKSVAIVGASDAPGSWADIVYGNIAPGYLGKVYPVHPKRDLVWGKKCFKSIHEINEEIDLVVFLIGGRQIPRLLEECATKKAKAALVLSGGFAELKGEEGKILQSELRTIAEKNKIRIIGPNCLGAISFYDGISCFAGLLPDPKIKGHFGAVSQSGSFCLAIMNAAQSRGLGLTYLFSSGNEAVIEVSDYIHYLLNDPKTKVVGAFIEGFKSPEKFISVADLAIKKEKPLIVLKVGRSQKAIGACKSHTGSLVGSDNVCDAIFKQKNIIRVESVDEMIDTARILIHRREIITGGVSFLTLSGGTCAYISDNLDRLGVELPRFSDESTKKLINILPSIAVVDNPLDSTGQARIDLDISYRTIDLMIEEKTFDMFFYSLLSCQDFKVENVQKIIEYIGRKGLIAEKFIGIHMLNIESWQPQVSEFYEKYPVPVIQGGFEPIQNYILYFKRLKALKAVVGEKAKTPAKIENFPDTENLLNASKQRFLLESTGHELLSKYGISSPKGKSCESIEEAIHFADMIGYPVALKIDSDEVAHKTDIGAVILNINKAVALKEAFKIIKENAKKAGICNGNIKILVQQMATDGVDVILGMKIDEQFGPVIMLGMGGVFTEILKDTTVRLAPIVYSEALEMIGELRCRRLFEGYRGKPAVNTGILADTVVKFSNFAKQYQNRLLSIDINPLRVLEGNQGALALDALIELR